MISFVLSRHDRIWRFSRLAQLMLATAIAVLVSTTKVNASSTDDAKTVAALDTQYQAAVKENDAATMDRILADDFVLVTGRGKVYEKAELLKAAREKQVIYEHQDEEAGSQKVRVWGDTAVVTALLWIKAAQEGKTVDYKLWFSDTYVRSPTGWRYVFGQASLPLPKSDAK
jgi:ketosteroid isomerase-like protein